MRNTGDRGARRRGAAELEEIRAYNRFVLEQQAAISADYRERIAAGLPVYERPLECSFPGEVLAGYAREFKQAIRPMCIAAGADGAAPPALVRLGSAHDGGYVMPDPGLGGIAYSLGIDSNVDWDLDMAARGFHVFQYDGSIDALPAPHADNPAFAFHGLFICGRPDPRPGYRTLSQLIAENGHGEERDMILKMDIEGAEWDVLAALPRPDLMRFRQIVLELHLRAEDMGRLPVFSSLLRRLASTHQAVHAHANNNGGAVRFNEEPFWYYMEVSYVRRAGLRFAPCEQHYPTPLDAPCCPEKPEISLGFFGQPERV